MMVQELMENEMWNEKLGTKFATLATFQEITAT
jgi:hypothetical protein